jgi:hypothetical protein
VHEQQYQHNLSSSNTHKNDYPEPCEVRMEHETKHLNDSRSNAQYNSFCGLNPRLEDILSESAEDAAFLWNQKSRMQ